MKRRNVGLLVGTCVLVGCLPDYASRHELDEPVAEAPAPAPADLPRGPAPEFGITVRQADPPPPLSGGTIAVASDGVTVVAADPDRDQVYVLDYRFPSTLKTVALRLHDEPGRVVVDGADRAHIALRNAGAVVTIDLATATVVSRIDVCPLPRGIAYDPASNVVHIACAGGEVVALDAASGAELERRMVADDLRDVVVVQGALMLSTFRDARILRLEAGSTRPVERVAAKHIAFGGPRVAWRMISAPPPPEGGDVQMVVAQQRAPESDTDDPAVVVPPVPDPYYRVPTGLPRPLPTVDVPTAAERCAASGPGPVLVYGETSINVPDAVLPVDVAVSGSAVVLAAAGNGHTASLPQLVFVERWDARSRFSCDAGVRRLNVKDAQITSVAFARRGSTLVALSREPAALLVFDPSTLEQQPPIVLSTESREDTGHAIFHSNSGSGVACASCHPDGRDDGHAWRSKQLGRRRTPSLLGTLKNTAPYHWNGEARDLAAVVRLTFESRMRGPSLADDRVEAMSGWLGALKAMPAPKPGDPAAAVRGRALFEGAARCASCHSGAMRTNNATVDVATGGVFQVPSLVGVAWRAPLLHDGSAPTVKDLLQHSHGGVTLEGEQIHDVDAYVATF